MGSHTTNGPDGCRLGAGTRAGYHAVPPTKGFLVRRILPLLVGLALLGASCGSSDDGDDMSAGAGGQEEGGTSATGGELLPAGVEVVSVSDDQSQAPEVELEPTDATPTELVIEDVVAGDGDTVEAGATVEVQYLGLLADGTEFDSSWSRGASATFGLDQVIPGWGQGLVGMQVGGRRVLVIPADLAYGPSGTPDGTIPPGATLVFVVDLVAVVPPPPPGATVATVSDDLDTRPEVDLEPAEAAPTEVEVEDVVAGDGDEVAAGDTLTVQYLGLLTDGTEFDSSWSTGEPATFPIDGVIPGWQEGLVGMQVGGRRVLVIPSDLGYGPSGTPDGTIPPDATLVFVVDLISIA